MAYIPTIEEIESIAEWKRQKREEHIRWANTLPQPFKYICLNPWTSYCIIMDIILLYLIFFT